MSEEDWIDVAMKDVSVVAAALLQLKQSGGPPPPPGPTKSGPALQLEWSVRQRRSKHVSRKKPEQTSSSPITPLSWSGATSVSGGAAEGFEESSRPVKPVENVRSKVSVTTEVTAPRRSRKRKTLPELKVEESLLLEEWQALKNELATLRVMIEKQRATNETLKRRKLDLLSYQTTKTVTAAVASKEATSVEAQDLEVAGDTTCSTVPAGVASDDHHQLAPPNGLKVEESPSKESSFLLPDLNIPLEDDSGCSALHEVS